MHHPELLRDTANSQLSHKRMRIEHEGSLSCVFLKTKKKKKKVELLVDFPNVNVARLKCIVMHLSHFNASC